MAFLQLHSSPKDVLHLHHEQKLKQYFKEAIENAGEEDQLQQLVVVDSMQRLGVAYHFQEEIQAILQKQHIRSSSANQRKCPKINGDDNHLLEASLRFRLLRQEGYSVTSDIFNKFINNEKLQSGLIAGEDTKGLVGLYEASHMSFHGEDSLEEAGKLSRQLLTTWLSNNPDDHRASIVAHSLEHPYHKSLTRFMANNFMGCIQGGKEKWAVSLQEIAKQELSMAESLIRNEILQVAKWWKDLGLTKELTFARDQPIKWYSWPMACLVNPRFSVERVELTKAISLVYIIDDIFDVHGTLDELVLFTATVARWDIAEKDELPSYMRVCLKALYEITNDISESVYKRHGWNPIETLKESWTRLCKAFLLEAQWFRSGQLPNTEDYLKNAIISTGVPAVLTNAFFLLGHGLTQQTIDLFNNNVDLPGMVSSTATILRLWDDFGSAKDEGQNGYDGSYIECYMKEHQGCSVEEAKTHVILKISDEWKKLNQECFSCKNPFSEPFTQLALNVSRMVPMMYDYNANHRLPSLEDNMKSLLLDSFLANDFTHDGDPLAT